MTPEQAAALREAFPASKIGKLPRAGIQLDYVGHAAVTDRLLAVDPEWSWEPVAFDPDGSPLVKIVGKNANLWIRLTVCGVARLGVGIVAADAFEREKQLISDAIRNGAMRFGVALDLWTKQDLHDQGGEVSGADNAPPAPVTDIDAMKPRELNAALSVRGLEVGGTVDEMKDRLRAAVAA